MTNARVRYAVVGLGNIARAAVLPAFSHAHQNSVLTALVSDDHDRLDELRRTYGVAVTGTYAAYERCLAHVDAVYVALPESYHTEFTIRAARAGVHVLCEKPMTFTTGQCEDMIAACRRARVKLMIAYLGARARLRVPELLYFSDCVHHNREPELTGEEGLEDVVPELVNLQSSIG